MPKPMHERSRQNHLVFPCHDNPLALRELSIAAKFITALGIGI
jgi:hypothetical protein